MFSVRWSSHGTEGEDEVLFVILYVVNYLGAVLISSIEKQHTCSTLTVPVRRVGIVVSFRYSRVGM